MGALIEMIISTLSHMYARCSFFTKMAKLYINSALFMDQYVLHAKTFLTTNIKENTLNNPPPTQKDIKLPLKDGLS